MSLGLIAQTAAADTKIGVVNPERILRESQAAIVAQQKLEKEFASREKALATEAKSLKSDVEKYQKAASKMNKAERINAERKLADRERQLQRRERELREDLNRRRNEELQTILMLSNDIIRDIARKGKYDLIVQEAVYVGPNVDITDQVIKALGTGKK
ncbi:MAG TPA: OmpH family outer membrane protein [Candidatus Aphodousia gallistercoris]|nr:OmpH family outer membrane protein [Candidatus Aphodousia gallistercoris]